MAEDKISKATEVALLALAKQVPLLNIVTDVVASVIPKPTEALRDALLQELLADAGRMQIRINELAEQLQSQGKQLDELGPTRTARIAEEFVRARMDSESPTKDAALINAAARQFDPRAGGEAFRRHWLGILASLPGAHVEALKLLGDNDGVLYFDRDHYKFMAGTQEQVQEAVARRYAAELAAVELSEDETCAVHNALTALTEWDPPLVEVDPPFHWGLSRGGLALYRLMADPDRGKPAEEREN